MGKPFLPLLAALTGGIVAGSLHGFPDHPVQIGLGVTLILILLAWGFGIKGLVSALFLVSIFFIGVLDIHSRLNPLVSENHIRNYVSDEIVTVEGMILDNPQVSPDKTELVVSVSRILRDGQYDQVSGRVLLNVRCPYSFHYGDYIRFHTRLRIPKNFENPGHFDYEKYLRFRGILVQGFIREETGFVVLRSGRGNPLWLWLESFRDLIRSAIEARVPGTEGTIIRAMILGDQKAIPKEVMEKFNRTGTSHIIAISGFNIGIVAIFSLFLAHICLKREYLLLKFNVLRVSLILSIAVVAFYTFVAGMSISVVRASIMVTVFMCAVLTHRQGDLYNTLGLAAFLILIVAPHSLFDISFQLSFTAVAALIFFMPRWLSFLPERQTGIPAGLTKPWILHLFHRTLRGIAIFFLASLSATLGTLPLILLYFNRLSLITLAANFLCVPILGVLAIPVSLAIIVAVPLLPPLGDGVIRLSEWLVQLSLFLIDHLADLPWSSVYVATPTLLEIAAFYLLLIWVGLLLSWLKSRTTSNKTSAMPVSLKALPILLALFFITDGVTLHVKNHGKGHLCLTAVDVGQGNSVLVRFPDGKTMLVDGGGFHDDSFDLGKYVLAPYLWHERITRVDTVVMTHPHPDHLQGLLFIVENFHVRKVWTNGEESDTELYQSFRQLLREKGIVPHILTDTTPPIQISGVAIDILNPKHERKLERIPASAASLLPGVHPPPVLKSPATPDALNDHSLVLKLRFGNISLLLPGDITTAVENRLVREGIDLKSDVVFVPHHGSSRSSATSFVERVKPQEAIISCGAGNVFGFPHSEVLERYQKQKATVRRTDLNGAITICTDGLKTAVSVFEPRD